MFNHQNLWLKSIAFGPVIGWLILFLGVALIEGKSTSNYLQMFDILFFGMFFAQVLGFFPALMFGFYWEFLTKKGNSKAKTILKYTIVCTSLMACKWAYFMAVTPVDNQGWFTYIFGLDYFNLLLLPSWLSGTVLILMVKMPPTHLSKQDLV